jgi:CAAX protease family protein
MSDLHSEPPSPSVSAETGSSPQPFSPSPTEPFWPVLRGIFLNAEGLRAGWRLLLFTGLAGPVMRLIRPLGLRILVGVFRPLVTIESETLGFIIASETMGFVSLFAAAALMAKLERRSLAHYALPLKGAFGRRFWQGAVWGLAALSLLIIVIWLGHGYAFGPVVLVGHDLFRYAGLWALAFLAVGFFEEFLMRGYALFTLTTGIGFWPSAVVLSSLFGAGHLGNSGESWVGALSAGLIGMFFCLTVRRTGTLWFAIGFHAAWDYAQSFIYSVPDSGFMVPGHLLNSSFHGPRWLTGGNVGPEGSVFVFVLIGLLCLAFARVNPEVRFPGPLAPASNAPAEASATALDAPSASL